MNSSEGPKAVGGTISLPIQSAQVVELPTVPVLGISIGNNDIEISPSQPIHLYAREIPAAVRSAVT